MSQLTDDVMKELNLRLNLSQKLKESSEKIWDKIVPGKIDRFISDNTTLDQEQCLLDQKFIKDETKNVDSYINSYGDIEVTSFKRVFLG